MIEKLKSILGKEYYINENQLGIEVYHLTNYGAYQEIYVKIKKYGSTWTLYEVQRGESFEICEFEDYNFAICGIYVLIKKIFEHPNTKLSVKRELSKCNEDELDIIAKILEKEFNKEFFSIGEFKSKAIMIENLDGLYDVNYCKENNQLFNIVKGREFFNAIIVFYNYILLLSEFEKLITYITSIISLTNEIKEKLKCCYLGK
ncbi:hypothetical protein [Clostridium felsineum]|uniref:hypothetical protein n=1 Tax=Clostridium felsineum TaxID=36839 RepID=UPI0009C8152F|nr:hypothetical protein [Clostridium felsineum]URZ18356.1 hypothetical protein CLFE_044260 [Clostridium felsineum DSM 794]